MPNHACRLAALAVLTLPVMLGACDLLHTQPAPAPSPPPAAQAPSEPVAVATVMRPTPLPERKPPQRASAPVPSPPSAAAEENLPRPPVVVGLTRAGLIENFGPPAAEREAAPARVLEFGKDDCRLAAYLYFDTTRNDFYALQYEVNGLPAPNDAVDRCLSRIARDASRR